MCRISSIGCKNKFKECFKNVIVVVSGEDKKGKVNNIMLLFSRVSLKLVSKHLKNQE